MCYVRAIRTMYIFSSFTLHYVRAIAILKNNHIFTEIFSNWISHDNYLFSLLYSIIMDILDFMDYIEFIEFIYYIKTRLYSWKYFSSWFRIVVTSQPIYECNYYMAGKNNGKYHLWLWSSLVKIMDLSLVAFGHSW